ncbi:MAG: hypothetical protein KDB60_10035 [Propionibacteriaceae bacterium]|nr:hypothetical protein [Propionibacteriaceae bacterium]
MPRQIGPDMLANLDAQLASGAMDQHTYDARKLEVQELIRKGKAFSLTRTEKLLWGALAVLMTLGGLFIFFAGAMNGVVTIPGLIISAAMFIFGLNRLALIIRH